METFDKFIGKFADECNFRTFTMTKKPDTRKWLAVAAVL
jgi:hypothetical protein